MALEGEVPPLPEWLAGLSDQGEAEKEVVAVVRAIEDQAAEAVRDLALAELELPAGAAAVTSNLIPLLEWSTLGYDKANDQALPGGCLHPEAEPIPPSIDNWARGAIPCKQVSLIPGKPPSPSPRSSQGKEDPHAPEEEEGCPVGMRGIDDHTAGGGEGGSGRDAVPHGAPSASGSRARRATDNRNGSDQDDGRAWGGRDEDEEGEIMELLTTLSDGGHHGGEEMLAGAGGIGDAIGRGRRQEERTFLEGLRRRKEARTRELADTRERLERADKEAREKEERMKKELKGRDWVWGPDGEVLVLDVIPPEKIPGRVVPRVGVRDRAAPPAAAAAAAAGGSTVGIDTASPSRKPHGGMADSVQTLGGGDSKASKGRSLDESVKDKEGVGVGSVGGAAGGGEEGELEKAGRGRRPLRKGGAAARRKRGSRSERFFEMSATSQPPLLDSLDLQAGVCVKEGGDEKQGPAFEEDCKHISRREFPSTEPLSKEPSLTLALESASIDGETSSVLARGGRSLDPQPGRRRPSHGDPLSPPATYPIRSASIGSGVGRAKHESSGRNSLVDRVKTLDPLSGATRLEPAGSGAGGSGGRHRGRRLVVPAGAEPEGFGVGTDDDPEDDPHWRLFKEGGNIGSGGGGGGFKPVPPPPLPRKRRSRQRPGVLTKPELRRPRDRGTRLPIPTVARKHLPPPPVGETMGHGFSPPRDRGLGASAAGFGGDAGGPSPPGSYLSNFDSSRSVGGPKRRSGGGGGGGGENVRNTLPRKRGLGERGNGKEFPALPGQRRQQPFLSSPPAEGDGGVPGEGGGRKGRRRGSALRMGWVSSRRSQGTLQELLRTT